MAVDDVVVLVGGVAYADGFVSASIDRVAALLDEPPQSLALCGPSGMLRHVLACVGLSDSPSELAEGQVVERAETEYGAEPGMTPAVDADFSVIEGKVRERHLDLTRRAYPVSAHEQPGNPGNPASF